MKRFLLIGLVRTLLWPCAGRAAVVGDVTGDGVVDVADVNAVINAMLTHGELSADVNGYGVVDVVDVNRVINIMLGLETPDVTGVDYVWDGTTLPEIHITVSLDEWNRLLALYDANSHTKQYVMARNFLFVHGTDSLAMTDVGLRLKGNTSRRRPEGNGGQTHQAGRTDWHHVHFGINLRKYNKDEEHTIKGVRSRCVDGSARPALPPVAARGGRPV